MNIDRVVVVTGVSSGIGYGVAKSLIAHQCHIFGRQALSFPLLRLILHSLAEQGHALSHAASLLIHAGLMLHVAGP